MTVSIVVVAHESRAELALLLASLQRHAPGQELIVVDTGADDGGAALADVHDARVIERRDNPGFGPANNVGLAVASHDVTVLLNPDVVVRDGAALPRLAAAARATDALHVPALRNPDGSPQRSAHPPPGRWSALLPALLPPRVLPRSVLEHADPWRTTAGHGPLTVGWAIAAALAARTGTLRALGPFDPDAFLHYEDLDLCLRAAERGVPTLLHPEVVLDHAGGHATHRAPPAERLALEASRRRTVLHERLGPRALAADDAAQALTFLTRGLRPGAPGARHRAQLRALRAARRG